VSSSEEDGFNDRDDSDSEEQVEKQNDLMNRHFEEEKVD